MASSDEDRTRRAELANELGFSPATLDPVDIERHRRMNAAADSAPSLARIGRKYASLREQKRCAEIEQRGRRDIADLYEDGLPRG